MKSICVYCGSNAGSKPAYTERAIALGDRIARDGLRLVYGGGNVGLMGTVANAVLAAGGEVTGVIPRQLADWEVAHRGLTELEIVGSMHERKSRMFDLADGFVALPGGFGTMEEIFEMLTWRQLGIGNKPCAFLDVDGFYAPADRHDRSHGGRTLPASGPAPGPVVRLGHRRDAGVDEELPAGPGLEVDRREAPRRPAMMQLHAVAQAAACAHGAGRPSR